MKRSMYAVVCLVILLSAQNLFAQEQVLINGTITDSATAEPLPFISVILMQNGHVKGGAVTDSDGFYSIPDVAQGIYTLLVQNMNYTKKEKTVLVSETNCTADFTITPKFIEMEEVVISLIRANMYKRCCFCGTSMERIEYFYTDPAKDSIKPINQVAPAKWYNLRVYPNPTTNRVNLTANLATEQPVQLEILDATGKLVLKQQLDFRSQGCYIFDLSAYSHGTFFSGCSIWAKHT